MCRRVCKSWLLLLRLKVERVKIKRGKIERANLHEEVRRTTRHAIQYRTLGTASDTGQRGETENASVRLRAQESCWTWEGLGTRFSDGVIRVSESTFTTSLINKSIERPSTAL